MSYADFWKRVVALLIDTVLLGIVGFVIGLILGLFLALLGASEVVAGLLGNVLGLIVGWLYFALMESSPYQGTVGKIALGIKVTDLDGNRIGFGRATGRHFSKILSGLILCVGYIMAAFTDKKQGLHDMLANTLVVDK
ncbi:hypothetical protein CO615_03400 [Lysobacteraceae bacterium NML75-0749]|nr:hypothetical protein CO611_10740 [Xanthomonadaceae bacterium NML03-0222]PJK02034.1 hypothetical protein CO615_03400 [Xanthomonadaceae bacterium NML75-0749]PJK03843.1 hypothetical protein CO612_08830 [Xanthomonadaceae bacterium NML71-0210]PJK04489.1 hypothetical protein CO609_05600 [Xanthomonadaceae bacterium NML91-0268]